MGARSWKPTTCERRPDYLRDLESAHAWLAGRTEIDAARIGIMGQSYGGWAVLAALTLQPELWRAGCDYYGIADFATLLEHTSPWRRDHRAREYGFPETDDALFERISPLRHVGNVVAPLLVLHADRDPRVPMNESELFVRAMRERGKPVRYERIAWAGHGFNAPEPPPAGVAGGGGAFRGTSRVGRAGAPRGDALIWIKEKQAVSSQGPRR